MEQVNQQVKRDSYPVALETSGSQMNATPSYHLNQVSISYDSRQDSGKDKQKLWPTSIYNQGRTSTSYCPMQYKLFRYIPEDGQDIS